MRGMSRSETLAGCAPSRQMVLARVPNERYRMSIQPILRRSQSSKTYNKPGAPDANLSQFRRKINMSPALNQDEKLIRSKLQRIRSGGEIRYMDMFAGCGGISLGFLTAGFTPVASVEMDPWAAQSHGANFGPRSAGGDRAAHRFGSSH